jgi:hypothetical protein
MLARCETAHRSRPPLLVMEGDPSGSDSPRRWRARRITAVAQGHRAHRVRVSPARLTKRRHRITEFLRLSVWFSAVFLRAAPVIHIPSGALHVRTRPQPYCLGGALATTNTPRAICAARLGIQRRSRPELAPPLLSERLYPLPSSPPRKWGKLTCCSRCRRCYRQIHPGSGSRFSS